MFWFFPIGHEQSRVRRWPYATFALILLNILFYFTSRGPMQQSQFLEIGRQQSRVAVLCKSFMAVAEEKRAKIPPPANLPPQLKPWWIQQSRVRPDHCVRHRQEFDQFAKDFLAGKIVAADHPMWIEYQKNEKEWEQRIANSYIHRYGLVPAHYNPLAAFTSQFLHANSVHLISNMIFLYLTGCILEETFGVVAYLLLYLLSGFVGNSMFALFQSSFAFPLIGASGAVAGLMGAFLPRFAKTRIQFIYVYWVIIRFGRGRFNLPAYIVLPGWFLLNLIPAVQGADRVSGVAYTAHVGGFLAGLAGYFIIKRLRPPEITVNEEAPVEVVDPIIERRRSEAEKFKRPIGDDNFGRFLAIQRSLNDGEVVAARRDAVPLANDLLKSNQTQLLADLVRLMLDTPGETEFPERVYLALAPHFVEQDMPDLALLMYQTLHRQYRQSPLAPKALFQEARLLATALHNPTTAREKLRFLLDRFPQHPIADEARRSLAALEKTGVMP